jgi:hypothetical protein
MRVSFSLEWVVGMTQGAHLVSLVVLPFEIGKALVAIVKRGRLSQRDARKALSISQAIPVRLEGVDVTEALQVAFQERLVEAPSCVFDPGCGA